MKAIQQVLIEPVLTEKSAGYLMSENITSYVYTFKVGMSANKFDIKDAIESRFNVEVEAVNTMIVRGKVKRVRGRYGKAANWKKAVIKLKAGNKIAEFEGA